MTYRRNSCYPTKEVLLEMKFTILAGDNYELIDPDTITVSIEDTEDDVIDSDLTPEKIGTGIYQLSYLIPSSTNYGQWKDIWTADFGNGEVEYTNQFTVSELYPNYSTSGLLPNTKYIISLLKGIKDSTGNELGTDCELIFYTTLTPSYASLDDLKPIITRMFSTIPSDSVLALLIHRKSLEADRLSFQTLSTGQKEIQLYAFGKREFVIVKSLIDLIEPVSVMLGGSMRKRLGDADITKSGAQGVLLGYLNKLYKSLRKWELVVRSGGRYTTDVPITTASLFKDSPETIITGRRFDPNTFQLELTDEYFYEYYNRKFKGSTWYPTEQ